MAFSFISTTPLLVSLLLLLLLLLLLSTCPTLPTPLIDELNQPLPPDFKDIVATNCSANPSLRYCNTTGELRNIYKSTIVARYLCDLSHNPDCSLSFTHIDLHSLPKLAPLYLSFDFFWKFCPLSIQSIDLSNNSLTDFPFDILLCTQIQSLDLSHNLITGELPVANFTLLTNLSTLNLSYNYFLEGGIGGIEYFNRFNSSSFLHSGLLPIDHQHELKTATAILLLIGVPCFVVLIVGCLVWQVWRNNHRLTPTALEKATNGFAKENLVWKGGKTEIYKGWLMDGDEVEINLQRGRFSSESRREFDEECRVLLELEHKNLARVVGWCDRSSIRALVTESNGVCSVEEWLLESPPWKQRLEVLVGVTEGMLYLQEEWSHLGFELKTNSVMLSADGEPIISRFNVGEKNSESQKLNKFGLFLLELVANKSQYKVIEKGESRLAEWVKMHRPGQLKKVIDGDMRLTATSYEQVKQVIDIGLACTDQSDDFLLTVDQVSAMIHGVCRVKIQNMGSHELHKERRHEKSSHTIKYHGTNN